MENKSNNILEIIVDTNRQLSIDSPTGVADNALLSDIIQVLTNLIRQTPIPLPGKLNGSTSVTQAASKKDKPKVEA